MLPIPTSRELLLLSFHSSRELCIAWGASWSKCRAFCPLFFFFFMCEEKPLSYECFFICCIFSHVSY